MNVLLINSLTCNSKIDNLEHFYHFPVGLLSIGTLLDVSSINVKIVDYNNLFYTQSGYIDSSHKSIVNYIQETLPNYLEEFKPDIIGIGCIFTSAFESSLSIAKIIKKLKPRVPIVLGGIHATIFSREIMEEHSDIDYIIIAEGEYSFLELVENFKNNKKNIDSIDGIGYRKDGSIIINDKKTYIDKLDEMPYINFNLVDINYYRFDTSKWFSPKKIDIGLPFPILSSRSCPRSCNFCSMYLVHGPKIRLRSAIHVADEIEYLYNEFGARYFSFVDDNFTFHKKRILDLCEIILKKGLDIQFDTPNGAAIYALDAEIIDAMVSAGLVKINLSPESGSEYIRNEIIGKKIKNEKIYEIINHCAKHKSLFIGAFFIIGLPQETQETLDETLNMVKQLPIDRASFSLAAPYPGTKLYDYCTKHNLLDHNFKQTSDYKNNYQWRSTLDNTHKPYFKPHKITEEQLLSSIRKGRKIMQDKRRLVNVPENYPIRYHQN